MSEEVQAQALGPRGGDLNNPARHPEWRREGFRGELLADGTLEMHRKGEKDFRETSAHGIKTEQAWHRMAALMMLAGVPNKQIAEAAGKSGTHVSILRSQRWFQELLTQLAGQQGNDVTAILRGEAVASVDRLVTLRDTAEREQVQLAAATTLLEHAIGKPVTRNLNVNATAKQFNSAKEEEETLLEELAMLRGEKTDGSRS